MKNLGKYLMIIAFISAGLSMCISISDGTPWVWQSITMLWIFVAYLNERLVERYKNLIEKYLNK